MPTPFLAVLDPHVVWNALPLVVAVSLVYAATRHEQMEEIVAHAVRVGTWIIGFMALVFVIVMGLSWLVRSE